MCGLAGWTGQSDPQIIKAMTQSLESRGPDAEGFWHDDHIQLGHRRLKIIDLQGGAQPMETKQSILVFNGEIYNHLELRKDLESDNIQFHSTSDSQVLSLLHRNGCLCSVDDIRSGSTGPVTCPRE